IGPGALELPYEPDRAAAPARPSVHAVLEPRLTRGVARPRAPFPGWRSRPGWRWVRPVGAGGGLVTVRSSAGRPAILAAGGGAAGPDRRAGQPVRGFVAPFRNAGLR